MHSPHRFTASVVSFSGRASVKPRLRAACLGVALLGVVAAPLVANTADNVNTATAASLPPRVVTTSGNNALGQMSAGYLFLYDASGSVLVQKGEAKVSSPLQQTLEVNEPMRVTLGAGAVVAAAFSNGVTLWVKGPASFMVDRFEQAPFGDNNRANNYEPTSSVLEINLEQGDFAFAGRQLSALSTLRLSFGEGHVLDAHEAASFLVQVDKSTNQDRVSILNGRSLLHHHGQKGSAVLIGSGQYLELERGRITQTQHLRLPEQLTSTQQEIDAHEAHRAQMVNDRIWFTRKPGSPTVAAEVAVPVNFWLGKPHAATRVR